MTDQPMHNPDAEKGLIGAALTRPGIIDDVNLPPSDFYHPAHEALWAVITRMTAQGARPDPVTALDEIPPGQRHTITPGLIADCLAHAPLGSPGYYAGVIAAHATRRRILDAATRIAQLARTQGNPEEIAEQARAELDATYRGIQGTSWIGEDYDTFLDSLDEDSPALPTAWEELTDIITGWVPGALYVVAARPSIGKSIFGVQAAVALTMHGHVALTTLEMSRREIQQRVTAHVAQVALGRLKGRTPHAEPLSPRDRENLATRRDRITQMRLSVDDRPGATINTIRSHARSVARNGTLVGIVVDYLGLLSTYPGDRRPRHEQVAEWSRQLKMLAQQMRVPVIVLAQLNRGPEQRSDKRPTIADLRDSGAVEQDADVVILLHADTPQAEYVDALVAKNRHGPLGVVHLSKRGATAEFTTRKHHTEGW